MARGVQSLRRMNDMTSALHDMIDCIVHLEQTLVEPAQRSLLHCTFLDVQHHVCMAGVFVDAGGEVALFACREAYLAALSLGKLVEPGTQAWQAVDKLLVAIEQHIPIEDRDLRRFLDEPYRSLSDDVPRA